MIHEKHLKEQYNRVRTFARVKLGIQQIFRKPYLMIPMLLFVRIFLIIWRIADLIILHMKVEEKLFPIFKICIQITAVFLPIMLLLHVIYKIGELTARRDEENIVVAFRNVRTGDRHPILISKRKDRKTGIITREFFSRLPMKKWQGNEKELEDAFSSHFVGKKLEYGGKNHDKGYRIIMYMVKGRQAKDRGTLYE